MVKLYTLNKLIKIKAFFLKNNSDSIDVIGLSIKLKEPESLINKYFKILVKKFFRIYIMAIMRPYLHMARLVLVSPVQFKVFLALSLKVYCNYVWKMSSVVNNKTNQKVSQLP